MPLIPGVVTVVRFILNFAALRATTDKKVRDSQLILLSKSSALSILLLIS